MDKLKIWVKDPLDVWVKDTVLFNNKTDINYELRNEDDSDNNDNLIKLFHLK